MLLALSCGQSHSCSQRGPPPGAFTGVPVVVHATWCVELCVGGQLAYVTSDVGQRHRLPDARHHSSPGVPTRQEPTKACAMHFVARDRRRRQGTLLSAWIMCVFHHMHHDWLMCC